jgi:competence protein ComEC
MASRWVPAPGMLAVGAAGIGAAWCLLPRPAPGRALAPLLFAPLLLGGPPPLAHGEYELRVFDVGHGLAVLVRTRTPGAALRRRPVVAGRRCRGLDRPAGDARTGRESARRPGGQSRSCRSHGRRRFRARRAYPGTPEWGGFGAERDDNRPCRAGLSWDWDGVRFRVLHPQEGFTGGLNDGSCVLLIDGPGGRVLLTGDIEARAERALLAAQGRLPVDVVVAPHHGSRTSSGAALVAATRPAWVVFSTNWRNRWGFPAPVVAQRWQRAGASALVDGAARRDRHPLRAARAACADPAPPGRMPAVAGLRRAVAASRAALQWPRSDRCRYHPRHPTGREAP